MANFDNLGSALQLLGCPPIQVEPKWMRPTPKRRAIPPHPHDVQSGTPLTSVEATSDPYQVLECSQADQSSENPIHLSSDVGPATSESSFEVIPGKAPGTDEPTAVPLEDSNARGETLLPLASSQASFKGKNLGQRTIVRPLVAPAFPRLSEPSRRPVSLRLPSQPAVRASPRPRFSKCTVPFVPLQRPVPLRAADYHRPRPLMPLCQDVAVPTTATSLVVSDKFPPAEKPSARAQSRAQNLHNGNKGICLQQDVHAKVLANALKLWSKLRPMLQENSQVLQELEDSHHAQELERRLLAGVSESTLARYLQSLSKFLAALGALGLSMHNILTQVHVADALLVMHREGEHVTNGLKAVRWAAKTLVLRLPDLYDGIMRTVSTFIVTDRKEALPFTAWIVAKLEIELIFDRGPTGRRLFIGAVLICIWGSLRYSDSQHVKWDEILASSWCMRSTCFRTKTSRRGVPFGVISWGIFGDPQCIHKSWLAKYLHLLGEEWVRLEASLGPFTPDCLFFTSNDEEFCPLSYGQVLSSLRGLLIHIGVPSNEASRFTLHSMKVTLLSILSQLGESESSRAAQGHHAHRESFSVKLYSRDDVWQALKCQEQVCLKLRTGWVPSTAQGRGGRIPVQQQSFLHLRGDFPDIAPASEHPEFPFAMSDSIPGAPASFVEQAPPLSSCNGDASRSRSDEPSSSEEPTEESTPEVPRKRKHNPPAAAECDEFLWILSGTGILHLATKSETTSSLQDPISGLYLKPSCGCRLRTAELTEPGPGARFCMHAACNKF